MRTSTLTLLIAADGTDFFFLEETQQLGLHFERKFADLVEKNGSGIGRLQQSLLGAQSTGKRVFFVAEQFAFDQGGASDPQSTATNGRVAMVPRKCSARATSSLPVPLSPEIRTGVRVSLSREIMRRTF